MKMFIFYNYCLSLKIGFNSFVHNIYPNHMQKIYNEYLNIKSLERMFNIQYQH